MLEASNGWVVLITVVAAVVSFAVVLIGIGKWLGRIEKQITPNGGNTNRLGDQVMQLRVEVAKISDQLEQIKNPPGPPSHF